MPRITITTDSPHSPGETVVLLDERIHSIHLSTEHASSQLIERLAWAVSDAQDVEIERRALADHTAGAVRLERRSRRRPTPLHERAQRVASA